MFIAVVAVVFLIGAAAAVAAPFLLRWPGYLRWLVVTASTPDPWGGSPGGDLTLDEVHVQRCSGELVIVPSASPLRVQCIAVTQVVVADSERLEEYTRAGTPILRIQTPSGAVSLYGPGGHIATLASGGRNVRA
ncbi:MAG TPA: hypothetical protein VHC63_01930 [Acidimicrobiales bacterium]|nr:hypothetical protein [Acidimicrobiales bacterium]